MVQPISSLSDLLRIVQHDLLDLVHLRLQLLTLFGPRVELLHSLVWTPIAVTIDHL